MGRSTDQRRCWWPLVAILLLAGVLPAQASGRRAKAADPALRRVLARMDEAQSSLRSLRARLVETRSLGLLTEDQVLRGSLALESPGRIRWAYDSPEKRVYVMDDGRLTGWLPEQNRLERVDLRRHEKRVRRLVAIGQDADSLRREFRVELLEQYAKAGRDRLKLVPRSRRVRKRVAEIQLWVDRKLGLPTELTYLTGDGDRVHVQLEQIEVNPSLSADTFSLDIPPGVKVVQGESSFGALGSSREKR